MTQGGLCWYEHIKATFINNNTSETIRPFHISHVLRQVALNAGEDGALVAMASHCLRCIKKTELQK